MTAFFDTNVLVYAFLDDEKRTRAIETLARGGIISVQVLNEFTSVARKKLQRHWHEVEAAVMLIRERIADVLPLTVDTHASALTLAREHSFAFYDALILASAIEAGCDTLYSEDMQHGHNIGGLTICNPFLESTE